MKIAILGWGSLCWNPRELRDQLEGGWSAGGPKLRLEFSRVSTDCRLTLVIDHKGGKVLPTRYAVSRRDDVEDAIFDLRQREGTVAERIGFLTKQGKQRNGVANKTIGFIKEWLDKQPELDAAIWTDLPPNYKAETGRDFSIDEAVRYLKALPKTAQDRAREYIACAPPEVATPLRDKLKKIGWWKDSDCKRRIDN